jgi:hypothetical protein
MTGEGRGTSNCKPNPTFIFPTVHHSGRAVLTVPLAKPTYNRERTGDVHRNQT